MFSLGAILGAMLTLYASVARRRQEGGVLEALGFPRRQVLIAFLAEAVTLSLVDAVVGVALAMKSDTLARLIATLGLDECFSRPRVSNDNPSRAHFKTMKCQPDYPGRFATVEHAGGRDEACPTVASALSVSRLRRLGWRWRTITRLNPNRRATVCLLDNDRHVRLDFEHRLRACCFRRS